MEQLAPAASVVLQAFEPVTMAKSVGLVPARVMPLMASAALPVLLSVAVRAAEVVATVVLGKAAGAVSEAMGAGTAVPVPVSAAVCGEPVALSATVRVAAKLAADAGVKIT